MRMLEHLFGSKTRVKLLRIFLHQPEQRFYVRELTRLAKLQINAVRRELQHLSSLGLIMEVADADKPGQRMHSQDRRYYQVNAHHAVYSELQALMLKADVLREDDLTKRFQALGRVRFAALTGSFVSHSPAPTDLFIVGTISKTKLQRFIRRLEQELNREINFTVMTPTEYKYRKDMTDKFLYRILEGPKVVLINELGDQAPGV